MLSAFRTGRCRGRKEASCSLHHIAAATSRIYACFLDTPHPSTHVCLQYFSLAATRKYVYGWGGNNYFSVGVGPHHPRVPEPMRVKGPLSDGTWTILGIAAGVLAGLGHAIGFVHHAQTPAQTHYSWCELLVAQCMHSQPINSEVHDEANSVTLAAPHRLDIQRHHAWGAGMNG